MKFDKYIIDDTENGCLIPIARVLSTQNLSNVNYWVLTDIETVYGKIFGLNPLELRLASKSAMGGLVMSASKFAAGIQTDTQIADGKFVAYDKNGCVILKLFCEGSSLWEIWLPCNRP